MDFSCVHTQFKKIELSLWIFISLSNFFKIAYPIRKKALRIWIFLKKCMHYTHKNTINISVILDIFQLGKISSFI
jgi:hypothetical protein